MTKAKKEAKLHLASAIPHKLEIWKPEGENIPKGVGGIFLSFFLLEAAQYFVK